MNQINESFTDFSPNIIGGDQSMIGLILCRWRFISIFTALSLCLGLFYVRSSASSYEAQVIMVDNPRAEITSSSSSIRPLSLLGGEAKITDFDIFKYYLTSSVVANDLLNRNDISTLIFSNEWDEKAKNWHAPNTFTQNIKRIIYSALKRPEYYKPDVGRVQKYLIQNVEIRETKAPAMTIVSYLSPDPDFAKRFLSTVIDSARQHTIEVVRSDLQSQINTITRKLDTEQSLSIRESLETVLVEKIRTIALIDGSSSYPLLLIQDSRVSSEPVSPKPFLIIALSGFIGLTLSSFLIVGAHLMRMTRARRHEVKYLE
jgi:LPS O-antigen subunit length determinant protein (WzzB/FepE family)